MKKVSFVNLIKDDEDRDFSYKMFLLCPICGFEGFVISGEYECPYCDKEKKDVNTAMQ